MAPSVVDVAVCALLIVASVTADKPCAARQIPGQSVVCVCNNTYCDEITRDPPADKSYVAYTSSEAGLRFKKSFGELSSSNESSSHTLQLNPKTTYRTIEGFGGAVTDAVGLNWAALDTALRTSFIDSYYSSKGLEYNMIRVPIGSSDFSTRDYAYNELPQDDVKLSNFSLSSEDLYLKMLLIKGMSAAATAPVHVLASTWSPPAWMRSYITLLAVSILPGSYYQTYADYHIKFIREYKKNGIDIWGITTTNEPTQAFKRRFEKVEYGLDWTPQAMGRWIVENLGPSFRNASDLKHIKILTLDDQRKAIPDFFNRMIIAHPESLDFIDGVAVHFNVDPLVPASLLKLVTETHPDKFVISSEGSLLWQEDKLTLGNWKRAKEYINDIMTDLNYNLVGWIDGNMCLNKQGGPNWLKKSVDSSVVVFSEADEFVKQPTFYAVGHFSKWIPRGSVRIDVKEQKPLTEMSLEHVAFLTPRNTVVLVVHNEKDAKKVRVQLGDNHAVLSLEKSSITTVEFAYSP